MKWEEMLSSDFELFFNQGNDLCVLPIGSLERHGDHLPVGNDTLKAYQYCLKAAENVPAVVMPPFYFTHVPGPATTPGAINLDIPTLLDYFEKICDEINRNGFRKIFLVSAHGGNGVWLPSLIKDLACKNKDYLAFTYKVPLVGNEDDKKLPLLGLE